MKIIRIPSRRRSFNTGNSGYELKLLERKAIRLKKEVAKMLSGRKSRLKKSLINRQKPLTSSKTTGVRRKRRMGVLTLRY